MEYNLLIGDRWSAKFLKFFEEITLFEEITSIIYLLYDFLFIRLFPGY